MEIFYRIFLIFHIILATVAAVFGISTLVLGFKKNFGKHRRWGKFTSIIWFGSALTGTVVYVLLYLLYPGDTQVRYGKLSSALKWMNLADD